MSEFKVNGKIVKILNKETGKSKADKEWVKLNFVIETTDKYDNTLAFEIFGEDKVEKFLKYNNVGNDVEVKFNIKTREWNEKYFTNLSAWSIFSVKGTSDVIDEGDDETLPF